MLEFSSENTYRRDQNEKKLLYASIGVKEYFLYDSERQYLPTPIMGFRLIEGEYVPIPVSSDGSVMSETLNIELRLRGKILGFYDRDSSKWLETPAVKAAARADQETARANREAEMRKQVEAEAAKLREELERLKAQNTK